MIIPQTHVQYPRKDFFVKKFIVTVFILGLLGTAALAMAVHIRFPVQHMDIIEANAGNLDPVLILSVIMAESSFRPNAESHAGAQGLMQLMPPTAEWVATLMGKTDFAPEDVWQPEVNIAMGSFYLNWLVNYYNGYIDTALAAYNAGLGNVNRWLADPAFSADGVTLHTIPFPETHNYVNRVHLNMRIYRILLALRGIS